MIDNLLFLLYVVASPFVLYVVVRVATHAYYMSKRQYDEYFHKKDRR